MSTYQALRDPVLRCARLAIICVCVVAPAVAQTTTAATRKLNLKSALISVPAGHHLLLTTSEIGAAGATSRVTIELRDQTNRVVATTRGTLTIASPVQIELAVPKDRPRTLVRAIVTVTGPDGQGSMPMAVIEDFDPEASTIEHRMACGRPTPAAEGPPSRPDGAQMICEGWLVDDLVTGM
jgi:hypothetical protein